MARTEKHLGWSGATGNRKPVIGLVEPILDVLADQTRAIGTRRITYLLFDGYAEQPAVSSSLTKGGKDQLDDRVTDTLAVMREIGLVHPDAIADGRSTAEHPHTFEGSDEYLAAIVGSLYRGYREARQAGQEQRIEVWTEAADTIPDLRELGDEYGIPVLSSSGQLTVDARSQLGRRMADDPRPTVILYLGDYDPAGLMIPHRLRDAEAWADRWSIYRIVRALDAEESEAWRIACKLAAENPGSWPLTVERDAVLRADLNRRKTTPVKERLVKRLPGVPGSGAYEQWWPEGETRTLQLEAIPVDEVVERVRARLEELVDRSILDAVLAAEQESRDELRDRLEGR